MMEAFVWQEAEKKFPWPPSEHHVPSLLQAIAVSDHEKQQPLGYFSLPQEIRDQIMDYVLVPGEILLTGPKPINRHHRPSALRAVHRMVETVSRRHHRDSTSVRVRQPPGFQLLATCKQACAEGLTVFYSRNIFYLPAGPVENTHRTLAALAPLHQSLIKKVGIEMSGRDLTPSVIEEIYTEMRRGHGSAIWARRSVAQAARWGDVTQRRLKAIWSEKLVFVLSQIGPGESFSLFRTVHFSHWQNEADGEDEEDPTEAEMEADALFYEEALRAEFSCRVTGRLFWNQEIRQGLWWAGELVRWGIFLMVRDEGWKAVRALARKDVSGGFGDMGAPTSLTTADPDVARRSVMGWATDDLNVPKDIMMIPVRRE